MRERAGLDLDHDHRLAAVAAFAPHGDLRIEIALRRHELAHVALGRRDQPRQLRVVEIRDLAIAFQLDVTSEDVLQLLRRADVDVERWTRGVLRER